MAMTEIESSLPDFTVVIEWENAKLSEFDRARRMLKALSGQIGEILGRLKHPPEILIIYDHSAIDPTIIQEVLDETFPDHRVADIRLIPTDGNTYYQQKNVGANQASKDIVVFLDSDVIPEPGWLKGLLETMRDPSVHVVGGNTYIELDSLTTRAYALFWFFPLRKEEGGIQVSDNFFANNVAFRRQILLENPFPDLQATRGACVVLSQQLRQKGYKIYINFQSRVTHPPPNGFIHMAKRAISQGHDDLVLGNIREPHPYESRLANALVRFGRRLMRMARHLGKRRYRKAVGLSPAGTVYALFIGIGYYVFYLLGLVMSLVSPEYVFKRFAV